MRCVVCYMKTHALHIRHTRITQTHARTRFIRYTRACLFACIFCGRTRAFAPCGTAVCRLTLPLYNARYRRAFPWHGFLASFLKHIVGVGATHTNTYNVSRAVRVVVFASETARELAKESIDIASDAPRHICTHYQCANPPSNRCVIVSHHTYFISQVYYAF